MFRAIGTDDSCRGAFDGRGSVVLLNPPSGGFFIAQLDEASVPAPALTVRPPTSQPVAAMGFVMVAALIDAGLIAAAPPSLPSAGCESAGARNEAKVAAET